ncbi:acyl-CoA dehydratase activase-related protein [Tissierella sp. Yu-01]|uniref:acyl-CoA dehydratase activase-related protein n=1 Tax=Tissierella sp. Yu-01 TaxID=3035694 RepID=UPI00240D7A67|nr:acyl-CoA dehydratase activase-related protein [Tissierella sp. Yu-01]WFA09445.1 acyl-CoA dehydratase activase-related protein [Tissierella sp. Yu-01]
MKITFPHLGNVYIAGKAFLEELGHEVIPPPVCSRKTLEIGIKNSPEMMCLPFKVFIGNYIESIEKGADTILITGSCGPCRFGLYSLMQRDILRNLGYNVDFIVLDSFKEGFSDFKANISKLIGSTSPAKFSKAAKLAMKLIKMTDNLTQASNYIRAYAINKKEVNKIMDKFYEKAVLTYGANELVNLINNTEEELRSVKINSDLKPLKIGIIGEIYTIIEPFVNLEVERKLGELNVLVDKSLTPTKWFDHHVLSYPFGSKYENTKYKLAKPYIEDMVGGHGRETVGSAIYYKNMGYDGVIQILPLNCMPEIVAKSILKSVSRDLNFPIMTLVVDEMTGEAGFNTRLEAFTDLISKRKEGRRIIVG